MTAYRTPPSLIAMLRRTHSARGRRLTGLYPIEGTRLVERALRAGAPLETVLVAERFAASREPRYGDLLVALRAAGCPVVVAPDETLDELTEGRDLGPILGLVRLPLPITLTEAISQSTSLRPIAPLFLAAVDIVDPGNVGALTRTAHAAGAAALLTVAGSDAYHPRATRISRGSIFKLPVIHYATAVALLDDLRRHHITPVATAAMDGIPLHEFVWPSQGIAVLMGNEAEGLSAEVTAAVDLRVTIPMAQGVDSYSVNAAAAIILYGMSRGRSSHPG